MLSENDIKEELSYVYAHAVATQVGYSVERISKDRDSVDIRICAKGEVDPKAVFKSPSLELQLKATSQKICGDEFPFPLSIKNYTDLSAHTLIPRLLVILALPIVEESWVCCTTEHLILKGQAYWMSLVGFEATNNSTNKTVHIPKLNLFNDMSLKRLMIAASKREGFRNDI